MSDQRRRGARRAARPVAVIAGEAGSGTSRIFRSVV